MAQPAQKPETMFRVGNVSSSVFANEVNGDGDPRTVRSVTVQRRYRDGSDWKYKSNFSLAELPAAIRVLQLAQQHVEDAEAKVDTR